MKKLIAFIVSMTMMLSLAACGAEQTSDSQADTAVADTSTTETDAEAGVADGSSKNDSGKYWRRTGQRRETRSYDTH